MVKFISFPINDYNKYLCAIKYYNEGDYERAIQVFQSLEHIPYFKKMVIHYIIECHIELNHYETVYELIENEFLEDAIEEDYLIEKYIYTMLLEKKYNDAKNLIHLIEGSSANSSELKVALRKLERLSDELICKEEIKKRFSPDDFKRQNAIIDLVIHLDHLNYDEHRHIVLDVLNDYKADPLVKYQLLKHLSKIKPDLQLSYTNCLKESYLLNLCDFKDIYEDDIYRIPPTLVYDAICKHKKDIVINLELIENIWLNDYLKLFPKRSEDFQYLAYILHMKILTLFGEKFDQNELKKLYYMREENQNEIIPLNILQITNLCYNK